MDGDRADLTRAPDLAAPRRDHRERRLLDAIEGAKLSDKEVGALLSKIEVKALASRDEEEVAGYAAVMETIFASWQEIALTENHIRQLHRGSSRPAWASSASRSSSRRSTRCSSSA